MDRTRIKFCGITRPQDAAAAAQAGANAIGLVFHPASARCLTVERAREIVAALPPMVNPVGLFVDSEIDHVSNIAEQLGLTHVQLHGHETPADVAKLPHLKVFKAVIVERNNLVASLQTWRDAKANLTNLAALVLESATAAGPGGTGVENDWDALQDAKAAGHFEGLPSIIIAGGLTPGNVGSIIRRLRPWAVDVSSGIETSKGVKSIEKMIAFAENVRASDAKLREEDSR